MTALGHAGDDRFQVIRYYENGKSGSGENASDPAAMVTADAMAIPAGTIVENVYVLIDTAVAGTTAIDVGDDDDADGYVPTASLTLGTPGLYGYSAEDKGVYLFDQVATTPTVNVPAAKLYSAAGKEVKVAFTGTSSAGALRVVVEGRYLGR